MRERTAAWIAAALVAAGAGCGSSSSSSPAAPPQGSGFFITISNLSFSPLSLHVPPGGTVTVLNQDAMQHSVTSETTPSSFSPGAVSGVSFDTGPFTGARTFTLPTNAPSGTVIPFFCTVHRGTMNTPNGSITVDPSAVATTASGGGGGGGGGGSGY